MFFSLDTERTGRALVSLWTHGHARAESRKHTNLGVPAVDQPTGCPASPAFDLGRVGWHAVGICCGMPFTAGMLG